jgi:prepilin-type N-terminal cleavage/methylation domain-containing protein
MTMTTRRGFTLVELMIGLILLTAVGAVTYQLLVNSQRVTRSQVQHIGMQDNGRSGALIIANELRELGYDEIDAARQAAITGWTFLPNTLPLGTNSDLRAIGADSINYRAPRGLGYSCNLIPTGPTTLDVIVWNPPNAALDPRKWNAYRSITTTDSLMLFVENNPKTAADDIWLTVGVTANQSPQNCPDAAATPGIRFRVQIPAAAGILTAALIANAPFGNPVRAFELMQLRSYASNGKVWLGMRPRPLTFGTTLDPVVGPLSGAAQGLTFTFSDANNNNTNVADNVRSVRIGLQPMSDEMVRTTGKYAVMDLDTVTTRVSLRNALRP